MTHDFHVAPGQSAEWLLDFDEGAREKLKETGRVTAYKPRRVKVVIACDNYSCSASAEPPVVSKDGTLSLEAHNLEDKKRLREIAVEEQRKEAERQRLAEDERRKQEASEKIIAYRQQHPLQARTDDADALLKSIGDCQMGEIGMKTQVGLIQTIAQAGGQTSKMLVDYQKIESDAAVKCQIFTALLRGYVSNFGNEGYAYLWVRCDEKFGDLHSENGESLCGWSRAWLQTHQ